MAATESRPPPNGTTTHDTDPDLPTSGFTAVNGRSPSSWVNGRPRAESDRSDESRSAANGILSPSAKADLPDQQSAAEHYRRDSSGSNKRKRTDADDQHSPRSAGSHTSQKPRLSPTQKQPTESVPSVGSAQSDAPPYAPQEPTTQINNAGYNGTPNHHWQQRPPPEGTDPTESRLMDALGRDSSSSHPSNTSPQHGYLPGAPHNPQQHPQTPHSHHMQGGVPLHVKPHISGSTFREKHRKRNFANRTKTGCMTCRERKKKCDEGKPTCNNCARGGFECKGYTNSSTLVRPSAIRDHHPIQAKNGFFDTSGPPHLQQAYMHHPPPPAPPVPPSSYPYPPPEHNAHSRPIATQEEHARSISDQHLRSSYGRPSWPDPHVPPYNTDPGHHGYPITASVHDLPRDQNQKKLPPPAVGSMPPATMQPPPPRSSPYSDPRMTAQLALQHDPARSAPFSQLTMFQSEKQKMTNQIAYDAHDQQLKRERAECSAAVYKYNKDAADPGALDEGEKTKRLRRIIEGSTDRYSKSPEQRDLRVGQLGENVEVSAPFYCDYGYNIKIGHGTEIGRNCTINDACSVKIGARCIIGPDVSFYTQASEQQDPRYARPHASKRLAIAHPIIIEDDVFIGGRAVILPGVSIGRGATIRANATVHESVKPHDSFPR